MERKEAIEIVRKLYNESLFMKKDKEAMVTLIPELAESEDERIRKALINVFSTHQGYEVFFGASVEDILAWLEKQGEKSNIHQDAEDDLRRQHTIRVLEYARSLDAYNQYGKESINKDIAWLEKQGEQKETNLVEILKHYPRETELYSPLYGKLWLAEVDEKREIITCYKHRLDEGCTRAILEQEDTVSFYSNGTTGLPDFSISKDCMLFLYDIEKQGEPKEKPTKEQVLDYCDKISSEWWQITMDKWNTLADEDKNKYNQFIGFNDFSDTLMNITAGALFQLIDTGKLEYEEGSLLLEKPDDTPKPLEVMDAMNEKQGEQKPDDKVEPKFKVGDWCIDNEDGTIFQIVKLLDNTYIYKTNEGKEYSCSHYSLEIDAKLWTIQDAKDGDVLCGYSTDDYPWIGIFHELNDDDTFKSYCYLQAGITGKFCPPSGVNIFHKRNVDGHNSKIVIPAPKEQRDMFFQKMHEAGYEWDFEVKELNKIEKKPACSEEEKQLLLKDLCARLPYGVKAKITEEGVLSYDNGSGIGVIVGKENVDNEVFILQGKNDSYCLTVISEFVPYLRPMSSMTEEEIDKMWNIWENGAASEAASKITDFLNEKHLDHHHLIEKGLALEAPEDMYNF